jgi:hypothetical protein
MNGTGQEGLLSHPQKGVADLFKPSSRHQSEKRAAEGEAAKAQAKRDAAAAAMKRQA